MSLAAILATSFVALLWKRKNANKYAVPPRITFQGKVLNIILYPFARYPGLFNLASNLGKKKDSAPKPNIFLPLDLDELKSQAIQSCGGIKDFGDGWHEPAFRLAIGRVNAATYSPLGKIGVHNFLLRRLTARLRFIEEIKMDANKGWNEKPVRKPLFLMGLPRTGTTYLHRLLSLDPASRSPLAWELYDPCPRIRSGENFVEKDERMRVKYMDRAIQELLKIIPHLSDCHEVGSTLPEECLVALAMDIPFLFSTFHLLIASPYDHFDWDASVPYTNYYKVLQLMQFQAEKNNVLAKANKRWVLKCPIHLGFLKYLYKGFPDANVVWTHRDPCEAMSSLASLLRTSQDFHEGSGLIHLDKLGKDVTHYAKFMLQRADEFHSDPKNKSCSHSDIQYKELIADPIGTVRELYSKFGYEFTAEYECILNKYIQEQKEKREGSGHCHKYVSDDYGLNKETILKDLKWYTDKYL